MLGKEVNSMIDLPVIQSLWIGKSLSVMEKLCISSFLINGHAFHLYVYDDVEGIPEGTVVMDANEIIPRERIFKYEQYDSYAGFANLFRYKLLLDKGDFWCDTDTVCLKPYRHVSEYVFSSQRTRGSSGAMVNVGVIKVPPSSKIMRFCYNEAASKKSSELKWGETGPKLLSKAVEIYEMHAHVAGPQKFNPINWYDWDQLIDQKYNTGLLRASDSVHLWNEMWRRGNVDKSSKFPKNCIYERLKIRYLRED